jgi:SAM-dependent methyltransferase
VETVTGYDPKSYWGSLHSGGDDLRVVGYPTLPLAFNRELYANAASAVRRALRRAGVSPLGGSVLDVGSGTGFWVEFWKGQGAATVAGVDLVPGAVEKLQARFPGSEFVVADISTGPPYPQRTFDVVSAMDVLLHIVDQESFANAVRSLAAQVEPSGALVLLEPLVVHDRWSSQGSEGTHNVARSVSDWERVLEATDLRIAHIEPAAFLIADPVDGRSRATFALNRLWWRTFARTLRGHEQLASVIVPPLAALDRSLARLARTGPSSKCIVLRRQQA